MNHTKPNMDLWQGRIDPEDGDLGTRLHQKVKTFDASNHVPGISFIGLSCDLGVQHNQGRVGAKQGPIALRKALANLAWHHDTKFYDVGDIHISTEDLSDPLAKAQEVYGEQVKQLLMNEQFVIGLGGGHEIAWASYQGCRAYLDTLAIKDATVGILNLDAHFDLRKPAKGANWKGSSGTPFYQVAKDCEKKNVPFRYACLGISELANTKALFNFAREHDVKYLLDDQCTLDTSETLIHEFLANLDYLYVTICLDALPASVCPGVSAPSALGIPMPFVLGALKQVYQACKLHKVKWLMSDLAELNPDLDRDQHTAKVAARLAYEIMRLNRAI